MLLECKIQETHTESWCGDLLLKNRKDNFGSEENRNELWGWEMGRRDTSHRKS
jgi:hypothetical protein